MEKLINFIGALFVYLGLVASDEAQEKKRKAEIEEAKGNELNKDGLDNLEKQDLIVSTSLLFSGVAMFLLNCKKKGGKSDGNGKDEN